MMYHMKNIIFHDVKITLPDCMYHIKNPNESLNADIIYDMGITHQAVKFLKVPSKRMADLEQRQDELLRKLDKLYDRITTISSYCSANDKVISKDCKLSLPDEIVMTINPDNLPWFINLFLAELTRSFNISWHIHSSVPNDKVHNIYDFINKFMKFEQNAKLNLRLIFSCGSFDSELKLSSLSSPIISTVNILRYLAYAYPNSLPYDCEDFNVDSLLDICHLLGKAPEKERETLVKKLFIFYNNNWIYNNEFSIVDAAAYNVIMQWQNKGKCVPVKWLDQMRKKNLT